MTSPRRRRGLALQVGLLTTAVALVSVLVATAVSVHLVRGAATHVAHTRLARDADLIAGLGPQQPRSLRARRLLRASGVEVGLVSPAGVVRGNLPIDAADVATLLSGRTLSGERSASGRSLVVEGRPVENGGAVVLGEASGLGSADAARIRRAELLALLAGLVGGGLAGVLLARRVARPLRAAAAGARRLAAGDREVVVPPSGPAEVAAVADGLNALNAALRGSEARQRDFLLSVSHELRTPLTAIRGFSEALADGVTTGEAVPAAGATMLAEAQRLDRLVSDLLDLARLGAAEFPVTVVDTDLGELVRTAGEVWQRRCVDVGVRLLVDVPDGPVVVPTDPTRVRQIVDGLAENALRVTPAGGVVVLAVHADPVSVEVRDSGPGLTDDDLPVAFDRSVLYERYRGVRRVGTGLGLAVVGGLAQRLGGHALAGHAAEGGASFRVSWPGSKDVPSG